MAEERVVRLAILEIERDLLLIEDNVAFNAQRFYRNVKTMLWAYRAAQGWKCVRQPDGGSFPGPRRRRGILAAEAEGFLAQCPIPRPLDHRRR